MPSPTSLDQIASPSLARGEAAIDVEHLERMTLGDAALKCEVLTMFLKQTGEILAALATHPDDAARLAHTLKGSAHAIGAFRIATCAEVLEAAVRAGDDRSAALAGLEAAVADARASIEGILAPSRASIGRSDPL